MTSHWPTDLQPDGTAPPNIILVASDDEHLRRQALYQMQAAVQLQSRGFKVGTFQVPLAGAMIRITVPIIAVSPDGRKTAVYTQCEEWNEERLADLRTWIADLREESRADVLVASRLPAPDAASAPGVATWLHLPYDTLNRPAATAPATSGAPLMPCLKEAKWQGREATVCHALWERESSPYMPWVAVGYDHPNSFEFINMDRLGALNTTEQALEAEAFANLRQRPAQWERVDINVAGRKLKMLVCVSDYFAAERVLDPAFMQQAQRTLKAPGLFVGAPHRGMLMATAFGQDEQMVTEFGAAVAAQFSHAEVALISPMLFAMKDGRIVGILEAVADFVAEGAIAEGASGEQEEADDPDAPYVSAVVVRNERGTEDVHLMAGGADGERLAQGIQAAFTHLLKQHMPRKEFSGHIQIVVLALTPPDAREQIPEVVDHLRGFCREISRDVERQIRVTLTFQRESLLPASQPAAAAASCPYSRQGNVSDHDGCPSTRTPAATGPPKSRSAWMGTARVVLVVVGALAGYFGLSFSRHESAPTYPDTVRFRGAQLSRANAWTRGGTSGAVYVRPGDAMPAAPLQVGVIVSTEHATADDLHAWIGDQWRQSSDQHHYRSGTAAQTCVVGVATRPGGHRTYMALQACQAGSSHAACVEADRVLSDGVLASCSGNAACLQRACTRRWLDDGRDLEALARTFLAHDLGAR